MTRGFIIYAPIKNSPLPEARFSYSLDEKEKLIAAVEGFEFFTANQHPVWSEIANPRARPCYFTGYRDGKIVSFAIILEKFKHARIFFGPVATTDDDLMESIAAIAGNYRKKGFGILTVQLGITSGQRTEQLEYRLFNRIKFQQKFDAATWSSITLDLNEEESKLFSNLSENHRRSVRKAEKAELTVREIDDLELMKQFAGIYDRMYETRRIKKPFDDTSKTFSNALSFVRDFKKGVVLGVFDAGNALIGGVLLLYEKNTVFYQYGATDPEKKNVPILHLAFWKAIQLAKQKGFRYFDFGGYNHFAAPGDQVSQINRFKDGFNGRCVFYPKLMYFNLGFPHYQIISAAHFLYKLKNQAAEIFKKKQKAG